MRLCSNSHPALLWDDAFLRSVHRRADPIYSACLPDGTWRGWSASAVTASIAAAGLIAVEDHERLINYLSMEPVMPELTP